MKKRQGFTLIEIIVALFIFAIIALVISYGLHTVFKAKERVSFHQERLAKLQMTLLLFEHDVTQLVEYPDINNANANQTTSTYGTNQKISFVSTDFANPLGLEKRSNMVRVTYSFNNGTLTRKIWSSVDQIRHPDATSRVLLTQLQGFKIRYLSQEGFIQQWPANDQTTLDAPQAVEITLRFKHWGSITQLYRVRGATLENFS